MFKRSLQLMLKANKQGSSLFVWTKRPH